MDKLRKDFGLVTMIVGILLCGIVLLVNAEDDILFFDDFTGSFDTKTTWEMVEDAKVPSCENSILYNKPGSNFHSRRVFRESISVRFGKVWILESSVSSDNNNIGITQGYNDNMLFFRFAHSKIYAVRRLQQKEYDEPDKISGWGTFISEITTRADGSSIEYDLRIDWWPGKLVRYYVNNKMVAEYSDHVMSTSSPIGVRDEKVYYRIDSIKVTKLTESADNILDKATKDRKKAAEIREQMITEYYKSLKSVGANIPLQVTDDPENQEFSDGRYVETASIDSLFDSIGFNPDGKNNFFFIQLTDTHIMVPGDPESAGESINLGNTAESLANSLNEINSMSPKPDFLVITGDLVCYNKVKEFQRFKEIMKNLNPAIDSFYVLGNHDASVSDFKEVFPEKPIDYSFDKGKWHFIVLFTQYNGSISNEQFFWLKKDMGKNKQKPTMIFHHHPMFMGWPNEDVRPLREKIFHLIKENQNVKWMFSGHFHGNYLVQCRYSGIIPVNLVTTQQTFNSPKFHGPPGYRIICVAGDKVQATIYKQVGYNKFRIDPSPEEFPVYFPPGLDYYRYIRLLDSNVK